MEHHRIGRTRMRRVEYSHRQIYDLRNWFVFVQVSNRENYIFGDTPLRYGIPFWKWSVHHYCSLRFRQQNNNCYVFQAYVKHSYLHPTLIYAIESNELWISLIISIFINIYIFSSRGKYSRSVWLLVIKMISQACTLLKCARTACLVWDIFMGCKFSHQVSEMRKYEQPQQSRVR